MAASGSGSVTETALESSSANEDVLGGLPGGGEPIVPKKVMPVPRNRTYQNVLAQRTLMTTHH